MPIHPAPPEDLAGMVEGYQRTVRSVIDLGRSCGPADFAAPTSCPGWSMQDHFAHVAAVEAYLDGAEHPDVELVERCHLRHEFGEWMEAGVQLRRERPGSEVVDELELLLHNRLASLANPELTLESEVRAPMERTLPLGTLLRLRLNDIWVHEQDLREALGRPGDLDTVAAATFVASIVSSFPGLVAKLHLPEGEAVILDCTGPVTARVGVRMSHGEDGRPWAHPLFSGDTETPTDGAVPDGPSTTIILSTDALTRRAAGRRSTQDTAYRVVGDEDLAARVLDALVITP
jgi:uncharacterized protein (TIGR03083 family)